MAEGESRSTSAARWHRLKELFDAALALDPTARAAYLDEACREDAELRAAVAALLAAEEKTDRFLETPPWVDTPSSVGAGAEADDADVPAEVGRYRVLREIGRGGMATVYLAERADREYEQRVALKLVRRGMDSELVVRRFRAERQILASLHHPNIARLLDGGSTPTGLPYFVMEHVEGQPIDVHCSSRGLGIEERLRLFRVVCAAVHHAHQRLVLHRDLKPANILVDAAGEAKLLDFGIAKLLGPESDAAGLTSIGLRAMTPEFASPEQVRGEPLSTASDVYSLGVLLYVLLAGRSPYRLEQRTTEAVVRAVCDQDPARPSIVAELPDGAPRDRAAWRRRLRGDLDSIVLTAMDKDPARRYPSAEQLGEEVRRHLEGLPVRARAGSASYRAGKFLRRHRLATAAAGVVAASLLGGLLATLWQARVAQRERARAERRFTDVRELAGALLFDLHDAIANLPGSTPARQLLVARSLTYLDELAREASGDRALQEDLASAYQRLGDVQGLPHAANLGDSRGAAASYRKALAMRERLRANRPGDLANLRGLAALNRRMGLLATTSGDTAGSLAKLRESVRLSEELRRATPADDDVLLALGEARLSLGDALQSTDTPAALAEFRAALSLAQRAATSAPVPTEALRQESTAHERIGDVLEEQGDQRGALAHRRADLAIARRLAAAAPLDARAQRNLAISHGRVGRSLLASGDLAGALRERQRALAIHSDLLARDPRNATWTEDVAVDHARLADILLAKGDHAGATEHLGRAIAIEERLAAADPASTRYRRGAAVYRYQLARLLESRQEWRLALAHAERVLAAFRALADAERASGRYRSELAETLTLCGALALRLGRVADARSSFGEARTLAAELLRQDPTRILDQAILAYADEGLGDVAAALAVSPARSVTDQLASWREARASYARALDAWVDIERRGGLTGDDARRPAGLRRALERCDARLRQAGAAGATHSWRCTPAPCASSTAPA